MPGKSKRKKMRFSSSNPNKVTQKPSVTAATLSTGARVVNKPSSVPVKSSPSASRAAVAQYAPDQFKYVGTELRIAGILSLIILAIIVALYFVLR